MGKFKGFKFEGNVNQVSHLQFVDDTLIICDRSLENVRTIESVLKLFELISGLKVNFHKSLLVGVNVKSEWIQEAVVNLNCKVGSKPFKYLGMLIGTNPRLLSSWKLMIDSVRRRLSRWANKSVYICGRVVLLKSVLSTLLVYFLFFFKAPSNVISRIESILKKYLWGGGELDKKIN